MKAGHAARSWRALTGGWSSRIVPTPYPFELDPGISKMLQSSPAAPDCQGCPWNKATHLARQGDVELLLCECCAQAHDEADGWTVTPLQDPDRTR